jgi:hypothetical protein
MQPVRKTMMTIPRATKKTVSQQLAAWGIIIKCLTKRQTSEWIWRQLLPQNKGNRLQQLIKTEHGVVVKRYLPKGTVCLLKISEREKNSVGLKGFASCNDRIELLQSIREHQV